MAKDALGHEGGAPEKGERQQHKAGERHQFELDDGDEDLDRQHEEGDDDDQPGYQQDQDLHEIGEQTHRPDKIGGGVEQRLPGIKTGCGHNAGAHEIADGHAAATGLQAKPGKALKHDASEIREVADDEGESADVERLLDQALQHILIGAPGPEQGSYGHVDDDESGRQEADLTAEQAEAAVDILGEDRQKLVDDAGIIHGCRSLPWKNRRRSASQTVSHPDSGMVIVLQRLSSAA